ncbi:MAG: hypothetical protein AVDCRST_MAG68-1576, partial [uncultured Gemmatimonadetes bacterium]
GRHERDEGELRELPAWRRGPEVPGHGRHAFHAHVGRPGAGRVQGAAGARLRDGGLRDPRPGRAAHRGPGGDPGRGRLVDGAARRHPHVQHPGALHRRRGHAPALPGARPGRV